MANGNSCVVVLTLLQVKKIGISICRFLYFLHRFPSSNIWQKAIETTAIMLIEYLCVVTILGIAMARSARTKNVVFQF